MRKPLSLPFILAIVFLYLPASVGFGQVHPDERARALATIKQLGGNVYEDPQSRTLNVYLSNTAITDEDLRQLGALPEVRRLNLDDTSISDAGIRYLKGLPALQEVSLYRTDVSEAGAEELRQSRRGLIVLYSPRPAPFKPEVLLLPLCLLPFLAAGIFLLCAGILGTRKPTRIRVRAVVLGAFLLLVCTLLTVVAILQALGFDLNLSRMFG